MQLSNHLQALLSHSPVAQPIERLAVNHRANMNDRYSTLHLIEDQYEPSSNGQVLRNKLGIIDPEEMGIAETAALWRVQEKLIEEAQLTSHSLQTISARCIDSGWPTYIPGLGCTDRSTSARGAFNLRWRMPSPL